MRFLLTFTVVSLVMVVNLPAYSMSLFLNAFTGDKAKLSYYCNLINDYVLHVNNGEPAEYVSVDDIGHVNSMLGQLKALKLAPPKDFKAQAEEQIELYDPARVPLKISEEFYQGEFFGCKSAISYHVTSFYQPIEKRPQKEKKEEVKKEEEGFSMSPWRALRRIFFN